MKIIYNESRNINGCEAILMGIEVSNSEEYIEGLVKSILDTSWISKLDAIPQTSYKVNTDKTIKRLSNIFNKNIGKINGDIGEYIVSISSVDALNLEHKHSKIPLSELWKSKVIGNDGFDFHTITDYQHINFGEAKYNQANSPYSVAAEHVIRFIGEEKDLSDLVHLQTLEPVTGITPNYSKDTFNYSISFSVKSGDITKIVNNSLESNDVKELLKLSRKLFVIGVKIVSL